MTKQEMIENEIPEQKPIHAMDPRELTKLFFTLTTAETEKLSRAERDDLKKKSEEEEKMQIREEEEKVKQQRRYVGRSNTRRGAPWILRTPTHGATTWCEM